MPFIDRDAFAFQAEYCPVDEWHRLAGVVQQADHRILIRPVGEGPVVGQMMDYAANARNTWQNGRIKQYFDAACEADGKDADQVLDDFLGPEGDAGQFWEDVETNLRAGKLRLLFVADHIPKELKAIIEFLNEQFASIEVLGFEIPQFKGGDTITLVPKLIGQTATSRTVKQTRGARRQWNEKSFFEQLISNTNETTVETVREILDWSRRKMKLKIRWGTGIENASFVPLMNVGESKKGIMSVYSDGYLEIYFYRLIDCPPFDRREKRMEWLHKLNKIPSIDIPDSKVDWRPMLPIDLLKDPSHLSEFLSIHEWVVEEIKNV